MENIVEIKALRGKTTLLYKESHSSNDADWKELSFLTRKISIEKITEDPSPKEGTSGVHASTIL